MAHAWPVTATKASAAKLLRISRRTVQRRCDEYDQLLIRNPKLPCLCDEKGKVNVNVVFEFIEHRKRCERRGFPLGQKRMHAQARLESIRRVDGKYFWARLPRRESKTFGRSFEKRLELIKREIDAMTDYEQSILLRQGPRVFLEMLRPEAQEIAANYAKLRTAIEAGKRPEIIMLPPRPRS
jgi:hypothetical protein